MPIRHLILCVLHVGHVIFQLNLGQLGLPFGACDFPIDPDNCHHRSPKNFVAHACHIKTFHWGTT